MTFLRTGSSKQFSASSNQLIENVLSSVFLALTAKMSLAMRKCNSICRIVRIRQMLQRWRQKSQIAASPVAPSDVPAGHVAVCVGSSCKRFIVRATHLNHPIFKRLLVQAEEEYGFSNQGPLAIPCDESLFEEVIRVVSRSESRYSSRSSSLKDLQRRCHVDIWSHVNFLGESGPLLRASSDKSVC